MCYSIEESENKIEQGELVMDLSYMQREAMDIAIGRLIHCCGSMQGDSRNDTCRPLVTARSIWLDSTAAGKMHHCPVETEYYCIFHLQC